MKNEKVSRLFLRFNGGGPVGYTQAMPGQLPQYQTGADLSGVDLKTRQDFEHYYGGKYPILAEGGDTDMDGDDQSFYTNKVNTFIKGIQETAQKNLLKEIMREAQGENEEKEYSDEEVIQAAYGMNFNQRPDYGNSFYDPGNLDMFTNAANKTGNLKDAFREFGISKYRNPDKYYTKLKTKFDTGWSDIFKEKNPVYTYGEMGYGGGLDEYQGDKNSSTTANQTGTGVTEDKNQGFRTQMINGKLYAIAPDGRLFEAAEAKKPETKTFQFTNRNKLTPEFAEAMKKGTYLDTRLLGPPVIEEKGFGPFKRNVTTWQYGKLSGDPYAPNNNPAPGSTTTTPTPGSTTQKKTTTGPQIDPSMLPENASPAIKSATDWNYRPGQDTDYFAPSGGWQDFPGTMQIDQAGPRNTDTNPTDTPFQSQYIPGSADYPNVPNVPSRSSATPASTTSSQSNVDPSGKPLPPGYVWDAGLNTAVMNSSANTGTNTSRTNSAASSPTNPNDWRNYKPIGLNYTKGDVEDYWKNIKIGKDFTTPSKDVTAAEAKEKQKIIDQTSTLPRALQMQVRDAVFNTSMDPRLDLMYAAGVQGADGMFLGMEKAGLDANGRPIQKTNANLRKGLRDNKAEIDRLWNDPKTQALIAQQYNDDPEAFTSAFGDQRKVSYGRLERKNGNINVRYPGWAARVDNATNNWDTFDNVPNNEMDNLYNALILDNEKRYGQTTLKKEGGTILPIFQGVIGPSTFTDMAEEEEYGPIIDPTTGKPLESKIFGEMTDADRINALDAGTEYDKRDDPNTFFAENPFNVEQVSKRKRLYDPNRTIRNMGLATAFFSQDERLANERNRSKQSQASFRYGDAPSFYGNDIVNTGKRMIGDGSGVPVFNTGYAQMGGSMLDNIKEGDEVYLTEEQINDIIKRGGKLSYL